MQRLELEDTKTLEIYCPFCGIKIWQINGLDQCKHVLFHASDEGFEFLSDELNIISDDCPEGMSIDEFTDSIDFSDSVKIAIYQPMPGGFGGYVGLAK